MTAAVLVTRNAEQFIGATIDSVLRQSRPLDLLVVVDDASTDATRAIIESAVRDAGSRAPELRLESADSPAKDAHTRIAANFVQGVRACADHDEVILGDHDDRWHPDRVGRQAGILAADPALAMVAGDGTLVDAQGRAIGGTLRSAFAVPGDIGSRSLGDRIRFVLGHSIATGGASAIRPENLGIHLQVPPGWLHDRWWSIAATAMDSMALDDEAVIDYLVHPGQQLGVDAGTQGAGISRLLSKLGPAAVRRIGDVHRLGRQLPSGEARAALGWASIVRNALG